jgi:hypothetical protein
MANILFDIETDIIFRNALAELGIYSKQYSKAIGNSRGLINVLRHNKISSEYFYNFAYRNSAPKCKHCEKRCEFISLIKGYHFSCGLDECNHKALIEANNGIADRKRTDYASRLQTKNSQIEFIKNNLEWYQNNMSHSIIDIYDGLKPSNRIFDKIVKNLSLIIVRNLFTKVGHCYFCNKPTKVNYFSRYKTGALILDDHICHTCKIQKIDTKYLNLNSNKNRIKTPVEFNNEYIKLIKTGLNHNNALSQVNLRIHYPYKVEFLKHLFEVRNIKKVNKFIECIATGFIVPITSNTDKFVRHLECFNINVEEYYRKYLPEYISYCKVCGNFISLSKDLVNTPLNYFCSSKCYGHQIRTTDDFSYQFTEECRRKLSDNMKNNIHWKNDARGKSS